jgi:hypothetical protein
MMPGRTATRNLPGARVMEASFSSPSASHCWRDHVAADVSNSFFFTTPCAARQELHFLPAANLTGNAIDRRPNPFDRSV